MELTAQVEVINGVYNFQQFMAPLQIQVQGLFGDGGGTSDTAHCFRMVRAVDVVKYTLPDHNVQKNFKEFNNAPSSNEDVVLLAKQYMSSKELSQPPTLLLPASWASKLDWSSLLVADRNELLPRAVKEFLKTSSRLGESPWNLKAAEKSLT